MKVCLVFLATCLGVGLCSDLLPWHQQFCGPNVPTLLTKGCRYFTKDAYGKYVCDRNQKPAYHCPILRPTCTRHTLGSPQECITDDDCAYNDKCCCDACLEHPVCKPPQ